MVTTTVRSLPVSVQVTMPAPSPVGGATISTITICGDRVDSHAKFYYLPGEIESVEQLQEVIRCICRCVSLWWQRVRCTSMYPKHYMSLLHIDFSDKSTTQRCLTPKNALSSRLAPWSSADELCPNWLSCYPPVFAPRMIRVSGSQFRRWSDTVRRDSTLASRGTCCPGTSRVMHNATESPQTWEWASLVTSPVEIRGMSPRRCSFSEIQFSGREPAPMWRAPHRRGWIGSVFKVRRLRHVLLQDVCEQSAEDGQHGFQHVHQERQAQHSPEGDTTRFLSLPLI